VDAGRPDEQPSEDASPSSEQSVDGAAPDDGVWSADSPLPRHALPDDAEPADPGELAGDPNTENVDAEQAAEPARRWGRRRQRPRKPRRKSPWWELPALVVLAILIAIGVKTWVIQPFYIPSESMEHTLHGCSGCEGDRILVNKTVYYFRDPEPGDIVVFNAPKGWDNEPTSKPPGNPILRVIRGFGQLIGFVPPDGEVLVKRVIAVGGQTVKGDAAGHVMISDDGPHGHFRTLDEPYVFDDPNPPQPLQAFGPVTVPKGRLWVMGDHRTNSADSRYHCSPDQTSTVDDLSCDPVSSTVPNSAVIGKAILIAWPPSRWRTLGTPKTFESAAAAVVTPGALPVLSVVPIFLLRRRSRRRR